MDDDDEDDDAVADDWGWMMADGGMSQGTGTICGFFPRQALYFHTIFSFLLVRGKEPRTTVLEDGIPKTRSVTVLLRPRLTPHYGRK